MPFVHRKSLLVPRNIFRPSPFIFFFRENVGWKLKIFIKSTIWNIIKFIQEILCYCKIVEIFCKQIIKAKCLTHLNIKRTKFNNLSSSTHNLRYWMNISQVAHLDDTSFSPGMPWQVWYLQVLVMLWLNLSTLIKAWSI